MIQHKDCLKGLSELSDNSIDVIITDPPYWLGSKFNIDHHGQYVGNVTDCKHTGSTWDVGDGYWVEKLLAEFHRVLKYGGYSLVFSVDRLVDLPMYYARKAGFDICQSLYWQFGQGMPKGTDARKRVEALILQGNASTRSLRKQEFENPSGEEIQVLSGRNGFSNNIEKVARKTKTEPMTSIGKKIDGCSYGLACLAPEIEVICCFRKKYKYGNIAEDIAKSEEDSEVRPAIVRTEACRAAAGKFPSQVLKVGKPGRKERLGHPTQKPLELIKEIIELFSFKNEMILDPFAGSGTILAAAKELGRQYFGFEINAQYFEIAKKRLSEV